MSGRSLRITAVALAVASATVGTATAAPFDDRILPVEQYTSEKARALARAHARALRELGANLYHCMPWVEIHKQSIGFFKPKHMAADDRYFAVRIYIEQDASPQFARLAPEDRASAMFSRYVGPLLRRMTRDPAVMADTAVDGFTVVLEWLKQAPQAAGGRPVHETIAVFLDKPSAAQYVAGMLSVRDLAGRARVLGWDGETSIGPLRVSAWEDDFVTTYKVKNYQPEPGASCP